MKRKIKLSEIEKRFWNVNKKGNYIFKRGESKYLAILMFMLARENKELEKVKTSSLGETFIELKKYLYEINDVNEDVLEFGTYSKCDKSIDHLCKRDFSDEVNKNAYDNITNKFVRENRESEWFEKLFVKFTFGDEKKKTYLSLDIDGIEFASKLNEEFNLGIDVQKYKSDLKAIKNNKDIYI